MNSPYFPFRRIFIQFGIDARDHRWRHKGIFRCRAGRNFFGSIYIRNFLKRCL